jgi:putative molybdopterin biosynthesis protein
VSALTIFRTFVAPAIRRAAGLPELRTATVEGSMARRERYAEGRRRLMPVGLVGRSGSGTAAASDPEDLLVSPVDKGSGATTSLVEADGIVEVPADTEQLEEGEGMTVQLFSPDVRPPTVFGVGEDDPALSRLFDRVERPRYLPVGSREGLRRLRNGVPDIAVTSAPGEPDVATRKLGTWHREWGLVVPEGSELEWLGDLVDRDVRFVNRTTASGLRTSLGNALAGLAEERGVDRHELVEAIDGFEFAVRAHESPARKVLAGDADAGLGLRATADRLGLEFVHVGTETVRVHANSGRVEKPGIKALEAALADIEAVVNDLPGYDPA